MNRVYDKGCRGLEVPLRALWCKVRGSWWSFATSHCERRRHKNFIVLCRKIKVSLILGLLEVTIK